MSESATTSVREKWTYRAIFLVCVAISLILIGIQGRKADQSDHEAKLAQQEAKASQDRLNAAMDRLGTQTTDMQSTQDEIKRVQDLNTKLQNELLDQSGELIDSSRRISELSKEGIATATGGDSLAYMELSQGLSKPGTMTPVFLIQGRYPVYDLRARIVDLQVFDEIVRVRAGNYFAADHYVEIGNITPPTAFIPPSNRAPVFQISESADRLDFRIFFNARNGRWMQDLYMRKVGNDWRRAVRIIRGESKKGSKEKVVFTLIDRQLQGQVEWHR